MIGSWDTLELCRRASSFWKKGKRDFDFVLVDKSNSYIHDCRGAESYVCTALVSFSDVFARIHTSIHIRARAHACTHASMHARTHAHT